MEPSAQTKKIEAQAETLLERAVRREMERLERLEGAQMVQPREKAASRAAQAEMRP